MFIDEYCVVRTYSAGVHCGVVESIMDTQVVLKNATRLWEWRRDPADGENHGCLSLSWVSQNGAGPDSRIDIAVPRILLTEAIEVIPCSEKGQAFLSVPRNH